MGIKKWAVEHYGTDAQKRAYKMAKFDVVTDSFFTLLFYGAVGLNVWRAFTEQDPNMTAVEGILAGVLASSGTRTTIGIVNGAKQMNKIGNECVQKMKQEQDIEDA